MAYEMVMPYHLHMPSYFLETFTEYPYTSKSILKMRFPIKNPLAGLILRMFNLPTGTILIKRLRLLPH